MAITTYAELQTTIADFLDRSDLTTKVPDFIALAEAHIRREIRSLWEEERATATMTSGQSTLQLPSDFNGARGCYIQGSSNQPLTLVTLDGLRQSSGSSSSGKPCMYAISDEHLIFAPTPDDEYVIELDYYSFAPLSDTNTSNSVLSKYPDLYLSLSMLHAYKYILDDAREMKMKQEVAEILRSIRKRDSALRFGTTPLRMSVR